MAWPRRPVDLSVLTMLLRATRRPAPLLSCMKTLVCAALLALASADGACRYAAKIACELGSLPGDVPRPPGVRNLGRCSVQHP